jgi:hypothetical protein
VLLSNIATKATSSPISTGPACPHGRPDAVQGSRDQPDVVNARRITGSGRPSGDGVHDTVVAPIRS